MAAVTLLAVANGAGDVITALVASGSDDGIAYNIGSLFGAGLFCTSFIMCNTIFKSKTQIVVNKMTIFRDVSMYIVATLTTIAFAIYGKLTIITSCIFLSLYFILVFIVFIQERLKK